MTTETCAAETARARLPELLARAHHGTPTVITRHGRPYALIAPLTALTTTRRRSSFLTLIGSGAGLWGTDSAAHIARLRDE